MNRDSFLKENESHKSFLCMIARAMTAVLILYYMWFNERYHHSAIMSYGAFIVLMLCLIIDIIQDRYFNFDQFHFGIWGNFLIGIYCFVTGIFVAYNNSSLNYAVQIIIQYSFIIFAICYLSDSHNFGIEWVLKIIVFAALLDCVFVIISPFKYATGRFTLSARNNPNTLGIYLVLGIFSVAYLIKPKLWSMISAFVFMGIMLYGIIMTGSRKSLIAAMAIIIISMLENLKETRKSENQKMFYVYLAMLVFVIAVGGRYFFNFYINSTMSSRFETMIEVESEGNRAYYYQKAWEIFLNKPMFGGGLDQFKYWSGTGTYSHSTYAEAIADFGLIGSLLYFAPIVCVAPQAIKGIFSQQKTYQNRLIFILYLTELFVGAVQIFFLNFSHFLAFMIIYYCYSVRRDRKPKEIESISKYIRGR